MSREGRGIERDGVVWCQGRRERHADEPWFWTDRPEPDSWLGRVVEAGAATIAALATIASPALIQAAVDAIPPALGPVAGAACAAVSVWALASGLGADR